MAPIEEKMQFAYFVVTQLPLAPRRKTHAYLIHSRSSGLLLGRIDWFGSWRQYCFWPEPGTLWSDGCLADVQAVLSRLQPKRRVRVSAAG